MIEHRTDDLLIDQIIREEAGLALRANGFLTFHGNRVVSLSVTPMDWIRLDHDFSGVDGVLVHADTFIYVLLERRSFLSSEEEADVWAGYRLVRSFLNGLVKTFFLAPPPNEELNLPPLAETVMWMEGTQDFMREMRRAQATLAFLYEPKKGADLFAAFLCSHKLLTKLVRTFDQAQLTPVVARILGREGFLSTFERVRDALTTHRLLSVEQCLV